MLRLLQVKPIKPGTYVLMKAALGSIYLNYQSRKLSLKCKLHSTYILFAFLLQNLLPKIIYLCRQRKLNQTILSDVIQIYRIPFKHTPFVTKKNISVGNLPEDIAKQVICKVFNLNSTSCLRDTCNIDFPRNNKTRKFKGFTY